MKKSILFFLLIVILVSCSKDQEGSPAISLINVSFTHDIPNCVPQENLEINCTEIIRFVSESKAEALVGGSDIVMQLDYQRNDKEVVLEGFNFQLKFIIQDDQTLLRVEDSSLWKKL